MNRLFLTLTFSLLSSLVFSQKQSLPGYIINNYGDTIQCKIVFKDWGRNPISINAIINNQIKAFTTSDIRGFGIKGRVEYRLAKVKFHTNPIASPGLPEEFSDATITKDGFLKILNEGKYNLFEYATPQRVYFFISKGNEDIKELIYRVKFHDMVEEEDNDYKTILKNLLIDEGLYERYKYKLETINYSNKALDGIVAILNNRTDWLEEEYKKYNPIGLDLYAGVMLNFFPASFDGKYSVANKFGMTPAFSGGVNFFYIIPAKFKRYGIGLSVGFNRYNISMTKQASVTTNVSQNYYYTTAYKEEFTLQRKLILINLYGTCNINPLSKNKLYLKAGVTYNIGGLDNKSDLNDKYNGVTSGIRNGNESFSFTENGDGPYISLLSSWVNVHAGLGFSSGRHKVDILYNLPKKLSPPSSSTPFKVGGISCYYYYTIIK